MGVIMDLIHTFTDMKKLNKLQETVQEEMDKLDKDGKLPAELKEAATALKNTSSTTASKDGGNNVEATVEPLKNFVTVLEKYENLFPDNIKSIVDKFETVTKDLGGIADRMDHLGSK